MTVIEYILYLLAGAWVVFLLYLLKIEDIQYYNELQKDPYWRIYCSIPNHMKP